jgi:UDP-N-acetylmuramoyl-tripeptide--D-alanyl-D-alanine ligase
MFKDYIQKKLEKSVQDYFAAHPEVKLICVGGSVGKTSTKIAIATILSQQYRVRLHEGNHNTALSAPLAILGVEYPGEIKSVGAWLRVFKAIKQRIKDPADVDVIIQELGTDRPGDILDFSRYLSPDIGVITGITPEHMENFGTLDAVAQEELALANFSKIAVINRDDTPEQYSALVTNPNIDTYGTSGLSEYSFVKEDFSIEDGHKGTFTGAEFQEGLDGRATLHVLGEHNIRPIVGAVVVALRFGMDSNAIRAAAESIRPVSGRMNVLRGVRDSTIIDDTYNSSPAAAAMALQTLVNLPAPQHVAVLGSMNELGQSSAAEHDTIGRMCRPENLDWVITIGDEAERYLAPAAKANGCAVRSFRDAISAGAYLNKVLETGGIALVKGSEGGIFAEEAVKVVLHSTDDEVQLVRQSPAWLEAKTRFFSRF